VAAKKATGSGRGVAGVAKGAGKNAVGRTAQKTAGKTAKKASTKTTRSAPGKSGRSASKSAASGPYKSTESKTQKVGTSATPARPTPSVQDKTGHRSPASAGSSTEASTAWQKKVTAGAIAATAQSPYAQATGYPASQPAGLPRDLQEYLEAFVAELDTTLVPAIVQRLRAGAARLSPSELAKRMLAVAPAPAPANRMAEQVGPDFYDTAGVTVVLAQPGAGPISKQAVEHRRRRRTVLALQTSDGRWIYPTWQFRDHEVMPGLADVLAVFDEHPSWSVGTWLTTPSKDLDGRTAVQWLEERRDRDHLLRLARHTAHRWAA
jgi:hypothetical protein